MCKPTSDTQEEFPTAEDVREQTRVEREWRQEQRRDLQARIAKCDPKDHEELQYLRKELRDI